MYWDRDWDIILLLVNNFIKLYSENEICIKRPILGCFCLKILCDLLHMHEENMHHLFFRNRINLFVYVSMNSYTDIKSKFYLFNSYCLTKIARLYLTNHFMWFFFILLFYYFTHFQLLYQSLRQMRENLLLWLWICQFLLLIISII